MRDESILDDPQRVQAADPEGMLRALASAGPQVRRTAIAADEAEVSELAADGTPRSVVVLGTGVAALAAEALVAIAGAEATAPILLHRSAELPRWVGAADMVIGLSPSGAGAEALGAAGSAVGRGARVVGVGADRSPLAAVVGGARSPYVPIAEWHWRRTSFWPLLTGLLKLVAAVGVVDLPGDGFEEAAGVLDEEAIRCRPDSEAGVNPAKSLALQLLDAVPVVWAGTGLAAVAAHRFCESLAGMAGAAAPYWLLDGSPQAMGLFGGPLAGVREEADIFADRVDEPEPRRAHPVLVRDSGHHPTLEQALELADYYRLAVTEVAPDDGPPLSRLAQLIGQLDLTAAYLAITEGLDPARETTDGARPV